MAYCGTEVVNYLSQVTYNRLEGILSIGTLNAWVNGTLIPNAERTIDAYVGRRDGTLRHFNPINTATYPVTVDGNGKSVLFIPPKYCPLYDIGTVAINGTNVQSGTASTFPIKVHEQYLDYDGGHFTEGHFNVALSGTYGYAHVPEDIQLICAQIVANILLDCRRRWWFSGGVTSLGPLSAQVLPALFGDASIFTDEMRRRLDTYRIKWVDIG